MARPVVRHTEDFDRILAIARRTPLLEDAEAYAEVLTSEVACDGSGVRLRNWQAFAIAECLGDPQTGRLPGGFLGLPVGVGKTLPMFLLPRLLDSQRPLIIVPGAGLVAKTKADFASFTGRWKSPNPMPRIVTQESLATASAETFFMGADSSMRPDFIALEEADEWANPESAAARRLDRYIVEAQEGVAVVALTATPTRKSIMGSAHIMRWCLRDHAPVPSLHSETQMWAMAIDDYGTRNATVRRPHPGPLGATVTAARAWFAKRLRETPGIVLIDGDSAGDVPLMLRQRIAREDSAIDGYYRLFSMFGQGGDLEAEAEEVPDGLIFSDGLSRWRIDGQLGCGYFLRYVAPGPPGEWRLARRKKDAFVRGAIQDSSGDDRPLDTEMQVLRRFPDAPPVVEWRRVCAVHGNKFPTEPVWISASGVESVCDWLGESRAPSIVWCGGVEFARAIAIATRLPYYGAEGLDATGRALHAADPKRSMIVSWHANKRGFNLQPWRRHMLTQPPQSAKYREQIYGRPHRAGQTEAVTFDELVTSGGTLDAFDAAVSEARFAKATTGLTQKILRAQIVRAHPRITASNRYRWATREDRE